MRVQEGEKEMISWSTPYATLAFFALLMAILSVWIKRSPWIWGSFLMIAGFLGFYVKLLEPIALVPIVALYFLHGLLRSLCGMRYFLLLFLTVGISIGLWMGLLPGFHSLVIFEREVISARAVPYSFSLSFDKPLAGFFVLAWSLPLIKDFTAFKRLLKVAIPLSLGSVALLLALAFTSRFIAWDPKFPELFWFFAPVNLVLVTIPDEALIRGFVQTECARLLGKQRIVSQVLAILLTACLFALLHYAWIKNGSYILLVFIAGVVYGSVYQITRAIEASILCHFLFNVTHFLLFTYPLAKSQMIS